MEIPRNIGGLQTPIESTKRASKHHYSQLKENNKMKRPMKEQFSHINSDKDH